MLVTAATSSAPRVPFRKFLCAGGERALEPLADANRFLTEVVSLYVPRQLEQRQRVSAGQFEQLTLLLWRHLSSEQRRGRGVVQRFQLELGEVASLECPTLFGSHRQERRDAIRVKPPDGERERVGRAAIEPVRVVDEQQQRALLCSESEQRQRSDADREPRGLALDDPEGGTEPRRLRRREEVEPVEEGTAELVERRERDLRLRLDAAGANDVEVGRFRGCVLEQGGLADPRLADEDECLTGPSARVRQQLVDPTLCRSSSDQQESIVTRAAPVYKTRDFTGASSLAAGQRSAPRRKE